MNQSVNLGQIDNPIKVWFDLALQTTEMLLASAHVVGHRTGRMALAGPSPSEHDLAEFNLMGEEKVAAATESFQAITEQMMRFNVEFGRNVVSQMMTSLADLVMLTTSRTPAEVVAVQARVLPMLMFSPFSAMQMSSSLAQLASTGLMPLSTRATANSRRLAAG